MKRILAILLMILIATPALATVSVDTTRVQYTCNGVLTTYAYTFKVLADTDLQVIKSVTATGTETTLTLNTDYTVTGAGTSGGNVVLTAGSKCGSGYKLTILRNMDLLQETDYVDGDAFSAESLENALDKITMVQQQQAEELGRSMKSGPSSNATLTFPNASANDYIGWNAAGTALANKTAPVTTTATQYEVDALVSYGTITAACTAIGTDVATLLIRPATWTISSSVDWTATCPNATFKIAPDAILTHSTYTMVLPKVEAGLYQIFSGTGTVTVGSRKYPEWWGAKDDNGTTDNTLPLTYAMAAGGEVELVAPNGGAYYITDAVTAAVAKTTLFSNSIGRAKIQQTVAGKDGLVITADDFGLSNVAVMGTQSTTNTYVGAEDGIVAYGADASNYISNLKINNVYVSGWGAYGIRTLFVQRFDISNSDIRNIGHAGIATFSSAWGTIHNNSVDNVGPGSGGNSYGIAVTRLTDNAGDLVYYPKSINIVVSENKVSGVPLWEALDTHCGENISFIGNKATTSKYGLAIGGCKNNAGDYVYGPVNVSATGNNLDCGLTAGTCEYGLVFQGSIGYEFGTGSASGNTIKGYGNQASASGVALYSYGTYGLSLTGNTIIEPGCNGAYFSGYSVGTSFTGNTIIDPWSNAVACGSGEGVRLSSTYNSVTMTGNTFLHGTKTATYLNNLGLRVDNETGNSVTWVGNRVDGFDASVLDAGGLINYGTNASSPLTLTQVPSGTTYPRIKLDTGATATGSLYAPSVDNIKLGQNMQWNGIANSVKIDNTKGSVLFTLSGTTDGASAIIYMSAASTSTLYTKLRFEAGNTATSWIDDANPANQYSNLTLGSGGELRWDKAGLDKLYASSGHVFYNVVNGTLRHSIAADGTHTMSKYGSGAATFDASGVISSASDKRLKTFQRFYKGGLAELMKLKPVVYKWNGIGGQETQHEYAGFFAQDVQGSIGELGIGHQGDGMLSLQDRALMATMVNAIKELQKEIVKLKKQKRK